MTTLPSEFTDLLYYAHPTCPGFKKLLHKDGVTLYSKHVPNHSIHMSKGYIENIACTPTRLMQCLSPEVRGQWDELFVRGETRTQLNATTTLRYMAFRSPSIALKSRDFHVRTTEVVSSDGVAYVRTVSEPSGSDSSTATSPSSSEYVRGEVVLAGFVAVPTKVGCSVTYVALIDPKGWIPPQLVNSLQHKQFDSM
eukprot:PhF_6_TR6864/c0_g1_i3/m.9883